MDGTFLSTKTSPRHPSFPFELSLCVELIPQVLKVVKANKERKKFSKFFVAWKEEIMGFKMEKLIFWFILLLTLAVKVLSVLNIKTDESGECSCGVFSSNSADPILVQTFQFKVACGVDGANRCQQICKFLARAAEDKAPEMICDKLKIHVEKLSIILSTKICNNPWQQTSLGIPSICCHNGKSISCNSQK